MKSPRLPFIFFFALLLCEPPSTLLYAQHNPVPNVRSIEGEHKYLAVREVSNLDYAEYLDFLTKNSSPETLAAAQPDKNFGDNNLSEVGEVYFSHPAYHDHPIVNITYEQAIAYCDWLTGRLNQNLREASGNVKTIIVRLPTEKEWETAAYSDQPYGSRSWYPWGHNRLRVQKKGKQQGQLLANYRRRPNSYTGIAGRPNTTITFSVPTSSGIATGKGFYHLAGNVAEMIATKGISKGGGWNSGGLGLRIDATENYSDASPSLGFRYLVEVLEFNDPIVTEALTAKALEAMMLLVGNHGFHAARYETSNEDFARFLVEHPEHEPIHANWVDSEYAFQRQYGLRATYAEHPVVNVSHTAAQAYCRWLTETYNTLPNRTYNEVIFYLPTQEEFALAARGGKEHSPYPWGGPYKRNAKGCYLANFSPLEDEFQHYRPAQDESGTLEAFYDYPDDDYSISRGNDGESFISTGKTYYPNDYGLYHMAGNVAEMVTEKGLSMGGGWLSSSYELQVETVIRESGPAIDLGFRVYMKVVE